MFVGKVISCVCIVLSVCQVNLASLLSKGVSNIAQVSPHALDRLQKNAHLRVNALERISGPHDQHNANEYNKIVHNYFHAAVASSYGDFAEFDMLDPPDADTFVDDDSVWKSHKGANINQLHNIDGHVMIRYYTDETHGKFGRAELFNWHHHKEMIKSNLIDHDEAQAVILLRQDVVNKLLAYVTTEAEEGAIFKTLRNGLDVVIFQGHDQCYSNLGSTTVSSDLDFSMIRWDIPEKVVQGLILFYSTFHDIFGDFPPHAFDMNFYIATGYASTRWYRSQHLIAHGGGYLVDCFATVPDPIKVLFSELTDMPVPTSYGWERLYQFVQVYDENPTMNDKFQNIDRYIAFYLIKKREEAVNNDRHFPLPDLATIRKLIQFSELFYWYLYKIKVYDYRPDKWRRLDMKAIKYWMNYYSDESYITDQALQDIYGIRMFAMKDVDKYLAIMDNLMFIKRYYAQVNFDPQIRGREDKLLYFWHDASKYIARIGKLLMSMGDWTGGFNDYVPRGAFKFIPNYVREQMTQKPRGLTNVVFTELQHVPGYVDNLFGMAHAWSSHKFNGRKIRGDMTFPEVKAPVNVGDDPMTATAKTIWAKLKNNNDDSPFGSMDKLYDVNSLVLGRHSQYPDHADGYLRQIENVLKFNLENELTPPTCRISIAVGMEIIHREAIAAVPFTTDVENSIAIDYQGVAYRNRYIGWRNTLKSMLDPRTRYCLDIPPE